jgi:hypothetical protein
MKDKLKPSSKLQAAIHDVVSCFQKTASAIDEAFEIGREEGFTDMEIGNMIRKEMRSVGYNSRTIRRALPSTAKHTENTRLDYIHKADEDKMSSVEYDPAEESVNKLAITLANKQISRPVVDGVTSSTPTQDRKQLLQEQKPYLDDNISSEPPTVNTDNVILDTNIEKVKFGKKKGVHNIRPEEYRLEDLEEYDNNSLIQIIRYLHKCIAELKAERPVRDFKCIQKHSHQERKYQNNARTEKKKEFVGIFLNESVTNSQPKQEDTTQEAKESTKQKMAEEQVKLSQQEHRRLTGMNELIEQLTGLDLAGQGALVDNDGAWRMKLAERTKSHRLEIIAKMDDGDIQHHLSCSATLTRVLERFIDQLRDAKISRKKTAEIYGV